MTKFKAGDKAVLMSVEPGWRVAVGAEVTIKRSTTGSAGPGYYVELCDEPGSCIYYGERRLGPVDDPLPPAPESVRYYTSPRKMNYLDIHIDTYGELCIAATSDWDTFYNYLDPDAALQLAHDLNRMANEIKRRERAQSGE